MATNTPLTGTPIPQAPDSVLDLLVVDDALLWVEKYTNLRFSTTAARDAAIAVPERGMVAYIGTTNLNTFWTWYDGTAWRNERVIDFTASAAAAVVSTGAGVGAITVSGGNSVITGGTNTVTFAAAGVVTIAVLFYMNNLTQAKFGEVVDGGVSWPADGLATKDRFILNHHATVTAGEVWTFNQAIASGTADGTFTLNGTWRAV